MVDNWQFTLRIPSEKLYIILCRYYLFFTVNETPNLREIQNLITPSYAHCWKEIGIGLNLPYPMLQAIESDYNKVNQRCTNMLAMWLQKDVNATWKKVLEVIDSPAVVDRLSPISGKSDHNTSKHVLS